MSPASKNKFLKIALVAFGVIFFPDLSSWDGLAGGLDLARW